MEIDEEEFEIEEPISTPNPIFKINYKPKFKQKEIVTNGIVSDALGIQAGDYICKLGDFNTIWQVIEITKEDIDDHLIRYFRGVFKSGYSENKPMLELLDKYEKNGNFGACRIHYNCVMRSGLRIVKGRSISRRELDWKNINNNHNLYDKVNISDIIKQEKGIITNYLNHIKSTEASIKSVEEKIRYLEGL
jgi:hypothetical protein